MIRRGLFQSTFVSRFLAVLLSLSFLFPPSAASLRVEQIAASDTGLEELKNKLVSPSAPGLEQEIQVFVDASLEDVLSNQADNAFSSSKLRKDRMQEYVGRKSIILSGVPLRRRSAKVKAPNFNLFGKPYNTEYIQDIEGVQVAVVLNPNTLEPSAAYTLTDQKQVYPRSDWVRIYLGPQLEHTWTDVLAGDSEMVSRRQYPGRLEGWSKEHDQILMGPYEMMKLNNREGFSFRSVNYATKNAYREGSQRQFMLLVDPKTSAVLRAFDMATGDEVYTQEDQMPVYADIALVGGKLPPGVAPVDFAREKIRTSLFRGEALANATKVVIDDVQVVRYDGLDGTHVGLLSQRYRLSDDFDNVTELPKVRLLVDLQAEQPRLEHVYHAQTGEQLYPGDDYLRVYVDPPMEAGLIPAGEIPVWAARGIPGKLWQTLKGRQFEKVVVAHVPLKQTVEDAAVVNSNFSLAGQRYTVLIDSETQAPSFLTVVLDAAYEPQEVYVESTGQPILLASKKTNQKTNVFLWADDAPHFRPQRAFKSVRVPSLKRWRDEGAFAGVKEVVLDGVLPAKSGISFILAGESYTLLPNEHGDQEGLMRVVVDPETLIAKTAHDIETGQQRFPAPDMTRIYIDLELENGRIPEGATYYRDVGSFFAALMKKPELQEATQIVLGNYPVVPIKVKHETFIQFTFRRKSHRIDKSWLEQHPFRATLVVDAKTLEVIRAYHAETGHQLYPRDRVPGVEFGDLSRLAGSNAGWLNRSGLEEIEVYAGATYSGESPFAPTVGPARSGKTANSFRTPFWDGLKGSPAVVRNYPTPPSDRRARRFNFRGRYYTIDPGDGMDKTTPLLLQLDSDGEVTAAFRQDTWAQVYPLVDPIEMFLGAELGEEGTFVPTADPDGAFLDQHGFPRNLWAQVEKAGGAVFRNYTTWKSGGEKREEDKTGFMVKGEAYTTTHPWDEAQRPKFLVQVDRDGIPVVAYDQGTGKETYGGTKITAHMGGTLSNGVLVKAKFPSRRFGSAAAIHGPFWEEVEKVGSVVFDHYPTTNYNGVFGFRVNTVMHSTGIVYVADEKVFVRVWTDADGVVLEAYDEATNELVYVPGGEVQIFHGAEVVDGQFEPSAKANEALRASNLIRETHRDALKNSGGGVVARYPVMKHGRYARLRIWGQDYPLNTRFDPLHRIFLWVQVDGEGKVVAAYDQATGKRLYSADSRIQVFLGEHPSETFFVPETDPSEYAHNTGALQRPFWRRVASAGGAVLVSYPPRSERGYALVKVNGQDYRFGITFEDGLLTQVHTNASGEVIAVYDQATEERLYDPEDVIGIYLGATLASGVFEPGRPPNETFAANNIPGTFWQQVRDAGGAVLTNYTGRRSGNNGRFEFTVAGELYPTDVEFEDGIRLLVHLDDQAHVAAAYNQATGEQLYSAEDDIRIEAYLGETFAAGSQFEPVGSASERFGGASAISGDFWKRVEKAGGAVLRNYTTYETNGTFQFRVRRLMHSTGIPFEVDREVLVTVLVNRYGQVLRAYDQATGAEVYNLDRMVLTYLGESLNGQGQLRDEAQFDRAYVAANAFNVAFWKQVEERGGVVFVRYPTFERHSVVAVVVKGEKYKTAVRFADAPEMRLRLETDKDGVLLRAFDVASGVQVYPAEASSLEALKNLTASGDWLNTGDVGLEEIELYLGAKLNGFAFEATGTPRVFRQPQIKKAQWAAVKAAGGAVLRHYPSKKHGRKFAFKVAGRHYHLDMPYSADRNLRLLMEVDADGEVLTAYAEDTGKLIYQRPDEAPKEVELYLGESLKGPAFTSKTAALKFKYHGSIREDSWEKVREAGGAVLRHYHTGKWGSKYSFQLRGRRYPTGIKFEPNKDLHVLLEVDADGEVLIAYAEDTGKVVYQKPDQADETSEIELFLGETLLGADFEPTEDPQTFGVPNSIRRRHWAEVKASGGAVLRRYPTRKQRGKYSFQVANQSYFTDIDFDEARIMTLLIQVDEDGEVLIAYDEENNELVYEKPDEQPTEIELFLGSTLSGPEFDTEQVPQTFLSAGSLRAGHWVEVQTAGGAVLRHYPARDYNGQYVFRVAGQNYLTGIAFDSSRNLRLLLEVDANGEVIIAYAEDTNEVIYVEPDQPPEQTQDDTRIELYLGEKLSGSNFVPNGDAQVFSRGASMKRKTWEAVKKAGGAVLRHYPARRHQDKYVLQVAGQRYYTGIDFAADRDLRLLMEVDADGEVLIAYAEDTGQVVHEGARSRSFDELRTLAGSNTAWLNSRSMGLEEIEVYYDVSRETAAGVLKPSASRTDLRGNFWSGVRDAGVKQVVLRNMRTHNRSGRASFSLAGEKYKTIREFSVTAPLTVEVVTEVLPDRVRVIGAWDQNTGQSVYPDPTQPALYYAAHIEAGVLQDDPEPHVRTDSILPVHWEAARKAGGSLVVRNHHGNIRQGVVVFKLATRTHRTSLKAGGASSDVLLTVEANPITREPIAAWDQASGRQVFPRSDRTQLYINIALQEGQLPLDAEPFREFVNISQGIWTALETEGVDVFYLDNIAVLGGADKRIFIFDGQQHTLNADAGVTQEDRLLLEVDRRTRLPLRAFISPTGEEVFDQKDEVKAYEGIVLVDGRLPEDAMPVRSFANVPNAFWRSVKQRSVQRVVLEDVGATVFLDGVYWFSLGGKQHKTMLEVEDDRDVTFILLVDGQSKEVLEAYTTDTHELVYPRDDLIRVYTGQQLQSDPQTQADFTAATASHLRGKVWERVRQTGGATLVHYPSRDYGGDTASFRLQGVVYQTSIPLTEEAPPTLIVGVDAQGVPRYARSMADGREVYPVSLDAGLSQIRNLAASGDWLNANSTGLEEVGILNDLEWREVYISGHVDIFEARHQGKRIVVVTEFHDKPEIAQEIQKHGYLDAIQATPHEWDLLIEGLNTNDYVEQSTPDLHAQVARVHSAVHLAGGFEGAVRLIQRGVLSPERAILAWALDYLDDTGYFLLFNRPEAPKPYTVSPLEDLTQHLISTTLKLDPVFVDYMDVDRLRTFLREQIWEGQLGDVIAQAEQDHLDMAESGDVLIAETVSAHLETSADNVLIKVGKYHLDALVNEGEMGEYTRELKETNTYTDDWIGAAVREDPLSGLEENFLVVLNPTVEGGKLVRPDPWSRSSAIPKKLWQRDEVLAADTVALSGVPVSLHHDQIQFRVNKVEYKTTLDPGAPSNQQVRLLVIVNPKTQFPLAAYELKTGQRVFGSDDLIQVYFDPTIGPKGLQGIPVRAGQLILSRKVRADIEALSPERVFFVNVRGDNRGGGYIGFSLAGQSYATFETFDTSVATEGEIRLRVEVDPRTLVPIAGQIQATGKQFMKLDQFIQVYFDADIQGGLVVGNPPLQGIMKSMNVANIRGDRIAGATESIVLSNVPPIKHREQSKVKLDRKAHSTGLDYSAEHRFVVRLTPSGDLVEEIYQQGHGDSLYESDEGEDMVIYLDPNMKGGDFVGEPETHFTGRRLPSNMWDQADVSSASRVVLDGVRSYRVSAKGTRFGFQIRKRNYSTTIPYHKGTAPRLRLVTSSAGMPLLGYHANTLEQVFDVNDLTQVFINPSVSGGRLAEGQHPDIATEAISAAIWKLPEVVGAKTLYLAQVETFHQGGSAAFSFKRKNIPTTRTFDADHPFKVLVEVDPQTQLPTRAFDMETGEEVFAADARFGIYLDPELQDGKIPDGVEPLERVGKVYATLWGSERVAKAERIGITNVTVTDKDGVLYFHVGNQAYPSTVKYKGNENARVLAITEADTPELIEAYLQSTGDKIYSRDDLLLFYPGARIRDGFLVGSPEPHTRQSKFSRALFAEDAMQRSDRVVVANVEAYKQGDRFVFHILGETYRTDRPFQEDVTLQLLVDVIPQTLVAVAAYDQTTGEQVYDIQDFIQVFYDAPITAGRLQGRHNPVRAVSEARPFLVGQARKAGVQRLVIQGMPVSPHGGKQAVLKFNSVTYPLDNVPYDASDPAHMLVAFDVNSGQPVEGYLVKTGRQIFPAEASELDRIRDLAASGDWLDKTGLEEKQIILNPVIVGGRLQGAPTAWRTYGTIPKRIWQEDALEDVETVAITGLRTRKKGKKVQFSVNGRDFTIDLPSDQPANLDRPLLVVVNPRTQNPLAGYDADTGVHLYDTSGFTKAYFDGSIHEGRLEGNPTPDLSASGFYAGRTLARMREHNVQAIVFGDVGLTKNGDRYTFSIAGEPYHTTLRDIQSGDRVLVEVDPRNLVATRAYLQRTREVVYRIEDQVRFYVDVDLVDGQVAEEVQVVKVMSRFNSNFLKTDAAKTADMVVAVGVKPVDNNEKAAFSYRGGLVKTDLVYTDEQRLTVVLEGTTFDVLSLYDADTGDVLYESTDQEPIEAFWGRTLASGIPADLNDAAARFVAPHTIQGRFWERITGQGSVVLTNYPIRPNAQGRASLALNGETFEVRLPNDNPTQLALEVNEQYQLVRAVDQTTQEPVAVLSTRVGVYWGAVLDGGKLLGPDDADTTIGGPGAFRDAFWDQLRASGSAVLVDYPTKENAGTRVFAIGRVEFQLNVETDASPERLRIELDARGLPVEAYDSASGQLVYTAANRVEAYLGAQLTGSGEVNVVRRPEKTFARVGGIQDSFWERVGTTSGAAFRNYRAKRQHGKRAVVVRGAVYPLEMDYVDGIEVRLSIEVDSRGQLLKVFDQATSLPIAFRVPAGLQRMDALTSLAASSGDWLASEELSVETEDASPNAAGDQTGLEELFDRWESSVKGADAFVLSDTMLTAANTAMVKAMLARMPQALARRTYLVGERWRGLEEQNPALRVVTEPGLESAAVAILQQVPEPTSVWVVGDNLFGLRNLLHEFGMSIKQLIAPSTIAEFLLQMGRALGVPEGILQSSLENFFSQQTLDLAA